VRTKAIVLATGVALLLGAESASATTIDFTISGTITSVLDPGGTIKSIFGTDGLVGDTYTANYVFNTSIGEVFTSPTLNYAIGGSGFNSYPSPLVSDFVTLTLPSGVPIITSNGTPYYSISNHNADEIVGCIDCMPTMLSGSGIHQQYYLAQNFEYSGGVTTRAYIQSLVSNSTGSLPITITSPFSYTIEPGDIAYSQLAFSSYNINTNTFTEDEIEVDAIGSIASTPLPASWTFLLIGFFGIGAVSYRRQLFQSPDDILGKLK
jgi:hypothetical protein